VEYRDDELAIFAEHGASLELMPNKDGFLEHDGARLRYRVYGEGSPVILLHGGLGHSGNWSHQVPALVADGHQAILMDSRGHGESTRDDQPYRYTRMAADLLAVMDKLAIDRTALVGWSDGATVAMLVAAAAPERVTGVLFFASNLDPGGVKDIDEPMPLTLQRCFARHAKDYAALSSTPDQFDSFVADVTHMMRTQPNFSRSDLLAIRVPVTILHSDNDEFIKREHADYLARTISNKKVVVLEGVSHFAPLQRPDLFNRATLGFLDQLK
jgi:pimeloyl-ACP methyl ester carboxylesterase